jgi:hypothetical protein
MLQARKLDGGKVVYDELSWRLVSYDGSNDFNTIEPFDVYDEKHSSGLVANGYADRRNARQPKIVRFEFLDQLPPGFRVRFD